MSHLFLFLFVLRLMWMKQSNWREWWGRFQICHHSKTLNPTLVTKHSKINPIQYCFLTSKGSVRPFLTKWFYRQALFTSLYPTSVKRLNKINTINSFIHDNWEPTARPWLQNIQNRRLTQNKPCLININNKTTHKIVTHRFDCHHRNELTETNRTFMLTANSFHPKASGLTKMRVHVVT